MTTYTKETALYNTDAIGSDIEGAGETATRYITSVTNDGIVVADASKGASNGSITSSTTGWHIGGVLEFIRNGVSRFWIGLKNQNDTTPTVRIGKAYVANASDNESHMELDYHSLRMVDKEGDTYFHVGDLRDEDGSLDVSDWWLADGEKSDFFLSNTANSTGYTVKVDGTAVTSGILKTQYLIRFSTAPSSGATVTAQYTTEDQSAKSLTFGTRANGRNVGGGSVAIGDYCAAVGRMSVAVGSRTIADGNGALAFGNNSRASGQFSAAMGEDSVAGGGDSFASGHGVVAASYCQTAFGVYNDNNPANAFEVGNGTSDSARSNAATIGWDGNYLAQAMAGVIQMFAGPASQTVDNGIVTATGAPNGWLICDGKAVSRTEYATLYAVIGDTYGQGDGSTTFNLPDLQGRVAVGAGSGTGLTTRALGPGGGSESLQSHDHNVASNGYNVPGKSGGWNWRTTNSGSSANYQNTPMGGSSASVASIAKTGSAGSGNSGNMQPFTVVNYIICTGKTI